MELSPDQKSRVEELLRTKGLTCPECGWDALDLTGVAYITLNKGTTVQYFCTNPEEQHGPFYLSLEPHGAQRISLG